MSVKLNGIVVFIDLSDPFNEFFNYSTDIKGNLVANIFPLGLALRDDLFFVADDSGSVAFKRPLTSKPRSKREKTTKEFSCEDFGCYWKKFRRLVKQNSLLIRTVAIINGKIRFELDDEKRLGLNFVPSTPYALWTLDNKEFERYGRDGLEQYRIYMTKLAELAHSNGINLTDVVYPWPDQIFARDRESRQVSYWRSWAAEQQVSFINLFPHFIDDRDPRNVIKEYFIPGDVHFNHRGHEEIANLFLKRYPIACQ